MINSFIRWRLARFEKRYGYDTSYLQHLLQLSRPGLLQFSRAAQLARYREDVPLEAWYAAKLMALQTEDCGPCVQLVVNMAREERVSDEVLQAILKGVPDAMTDDAALGWHYAQAAVTHGVDIARWQDEILRRWGPRALASLALAITASRLFPMLKYALGHGQSCQRVQIGQASWHPTLQSQQAHAHTAR